MAHSAQARKRARQAEKRRVKNKSFRNEIKSLTKNLEEKVTAKDKPGAEALFKEVVSKLDKAAKAHVFHQNAAARKKSQVAVLLNKLG
jgi:small subunit ribosomal protein S20